jgi:hypothetical protein
MVSIGSALLAPLRRHLRFDLFSLLAAIRQRASMLGALIPVSYACAPTGDTELIAGLLSATADRLPSLGALALIVVAAMAVTPFLSFGHYWRCLTFRSQS